MPLQAIRAPAVAGAFYPATADALQSQVEILMGEAPAPAQPRRPKALIAPHAGYVYSGPTAARAYKLLAPFRDSYDRVVLLGPAHRVRVRGLALPASAAFATPLGEVPLDRAAMERIAALPQVEVSDEAHAWEHSLEVHLPFLQQVLPRFTLVPIAVGGATPQEVAEVLDRLWGGDETLILVSSDLSHYLAYAQAQEIDGRTLRTILDLKPDLDHRQACGATPVNGLLLQARRRRLVPELVDARNSGDTAGDRNRVVGYGSVAFFPAAAGNVPDAVDGRMLVSLARAAISARLGWHYAVAANAPFLERQGATFVTLTRDGQLRGCIGSLQAHRSLREDVLANAEAAAFRDPRFEPLTFDELRAVRVEVSLLSPPEPMTFTGEAGLLAQLRPGTDGLIIEQAGRRATFLPQVWETLPEPARFLAELKRKAGLPADSGDEGLRAWRYTVTKWAEADSR